MGKTDRSYDRPADRKRTPRAKSETLARKSQRRAKYAANGRTVTR